ncbi:MAG: hypothetical protein Q7T50_07410, partial [Candidatus Magasanikbacteria bacterium]|nr:hypothetical protein [Candidatus Magasanikbacteria bacterium]
EKRRQEQISVDQQIKSVESLIKEISNILCEEKAHEDLCNDLATDISFSSSVISKAEYEEYFYQKNKLFNEEEKYISAKLRKNSPQFACVKGDSRGKYNSRAEDRDNSGTVKDYYKEKRKGGGRLSQHQSRKIGMNIDSYFSHDLFCPPRVAIINASPESFFMSRRKAHEKKLREARQNKTCSRIKKRVTRRKKRIDSSLKNKEAWNVVMNESDRWSTRFHYFIFKNFSWQNGQAPERINGFVYDVSEEKIAEKLGLTIKVNRNVGSEVVVGYKKSKLAKTIYYLRETTLPEGNVIRKI